MIQQVKPVVLTEKDKTNFKNLCGIIVKHPDQKVPNIHLFHCLTIPVSLLVRMLIFRSSDNFYSHRSSVQTSTVRLQIQRVRRHERAARRRLERIMKSWQKFTLKMLMSTREFGNGID